MGCCLIRHAEAVEPLPGQGDPGRPLTARGRERFRRTARALARRGDCFDLILTSPLVRAVQTAEILAQATGFTGELAVVPELAGVLDRDGLARLLTRYPAARRPALVGHEPGLGLLAGQLLGLPLPVPLRKGEVLCLDGDPAKPGATVFRWSARNGSQVTAPDRWLAARLERTIPRDGGPSAAEPLWHAARRILSGRSDDLFRRWERAAASGEREEIHDLRVSSRRLREGLLLFAPLYPGGAGIARRVKRLTTLLGEQRNLDEALAFFTALGQEPAPPAGEGLAALTGQLQARRDRVGDGTAAGLARLDRDAFRRRLERLIGRPALLEVPPDGTDPFAPVARFGRQGLAGRCAVLPALAAAAAVEAAAEAQHRLRIAVKHLRYRVELLSFLLGPGYDACHDALKGYQELLGTLHDLDVFAELAAGSGVPLRDLRGVTEAIAARRRAVYAAFRARLEAVPPTTICDFLRSIP